MNYATQTSQAVKPQVSTARKIAAGSIGNAVEWFDWTIYASFAVFFSTQFFPKTDETASLLATFAIFAVGFFMRPIGGWALGSVRKVLSQAPHSAGQ